jgi:NADH-quinone oxidoreductase subunit J
MSLAVGLFIIAAFITGLGAVGVVASRSMVRSAVWLLVALSGIALLYLLLGAEFLGAVQLIVYVGGTMVLIVFGVMLTNQGPFAGFKPKRLEWILGGVVAMLLFAGLVRISLQLGQQGTASPDGPLPGVNSLGLSLLGVPEKPGGTAYLLPFEIVSVHLLVVLIAAAYLARTKRKPEAKP